MKEIAIKNKSFLTILNKFEWFYQNKSDLDDIVADCSDDGDKGEYYTGEEYLKVIQGMGSSHNGYPAKLYGYSLRDMNHNRPSNKSMPTHWSQRYSDLNSQLMTELSVRNNAVASLYPPKGYISWHNNANASGFNLIFTWSETGDGWFDYIDEDGIRQRCQDRAGEWVCRYGYFGAYDQNKYPIVYHAASTDCWRMTVAYVFSKEEAAGGIQEFIIDELTTE